MQKAVLLVNLGTPDGTQPKQVKKYLTEFLNDPFVIDLPWLIRKLLVNLIIIPFRVKKSTRLYRRLWTDAGSPISIYLEQLKVKLQKEMGEDVAVYAAMRYGNPALKDVLMQINERGADELMVVPLFPQYASSTTGSIIHAVQKNKNSLQNVKQIHFAEQFYNDPEFINAFCERITAYQPTTFNHIIFSFHSLPVRHIEKMHPESPCAGCICEDHFPSFGTKCFKATSYETARLIANKLQIKREDYTVAFQSRFAKNWIGPFTDNIIIQSALSGKSKVLIVAPSFTADCLETIIEIGQDYKTLFTAHGGKELTMVESLNAENYWVKALKKIIFSKNPNP